MQEDNVNHPKHYQTEGGIECIEMIASTLGKDGYARYCQGNVIKYIVRYRQKGGIESLRKAEWYLRELIRTENPNVEKRATCDGCRWLVDMTDPQGRIHRGWCLNEDGRYGYRMEDSLGRCEFFEKEQDSQPPVVECKTCANAKVISGSLLYCSDKHVEKKEHDNCEMWECRRTV